MSTYALELIDGGYTITKDGVPCIRQVTVPGTQLPIADDQREALGNEEIAGLATRDQAAAAAAQAASNPTP